MAALPRYDMCSTPPNQPSEGHDTLRSPEEDVRKRGTMTMASVPRVTVVVVENILLD